MEKRQSNYFANQTAIHKGKTSLQAEYNDACTYKRGMHSLFPQCIVRIKYMLYTFALGLRQKSQPTTIYIRSPVFQIVLTKQSVFQTTVFINQFSTLFMRGVFIIWQDSVTFPSHTVTFPWFPTNCTRSNKQTYFSTGFFCFSTHGSFLLLAPSVKRCKIFSCTVYKIGFSLDAETQSFRSFR